MSVLCLCAGQAHVGVSTQIKRELQSERAGSEYVEHMDRIMCPAARLHQPAPHLLLMAVLMPELHRSCCHTTAAQEVAAHDGLRLQSW